MKQTTLLLLFIFTLVACGATETETELVTKANEAVDEAVEVVEDVAKSAETAETSKEPAEIVAEAETWQTIELVDAQTGETFTFADYAGETVFVEPFATWCGNCKNQLFNVMNALNTVYSSGNQDVKTIALSIETNLTNEQLAEYANAQGFPFQFAVATPELLRALADEFGSAVTAAPSTPHFIIRPDGTTTTLATGMESAEDIAAEILEIQ